MAKRSPILGYNHNVRYRGLVFHVQTEDSGLLNPHLFTHLFYEGVIVSTRKLVYDAGANEEAIKALMQAQHKAVMKDLRKGAFDDKIDQYLGDKPGLEPRGAAAARAKPAAPAAAPAKETSAAPANESSAAPVEIVNEGLSEPIELPVKSRTGSGDRTVPVSTPPAAEPAQASAAAPAKPRTTTAQRGSRTSADIARAPTQLAPGASLEIRESSPVIEISVDDDDDDYNERSRSSRDTAVEVAVDDSSAPHSVEAAITTPHRQNRPASHGAATLPARPPSRPIAPPVVTRPATQDRKRSDSDVVEVYSPPPASAEPPPGERAERPGQYLMSRKEGTAIREKTGKLPPATPPARTRPPGSGQNAIAPNTQRPVPPTRGAQPPQRTATPAAGTRVPAPASRVHVTAPITNRAQSPSTAGSGSGVVMTRPAVIVGAPPKPPAPPRVRKAREDEGRGFGQGLISEKSLDEVILAYLSEDAEDK